MATQAIFSLGIYPSMSYARGGTSYGLLLNQSIKPLSIFLFFKFFYFIVFKYLDVILCRHLIWDYVIKGRNSRYSTSICWQMFKNSKQFQEFEYNNIF